MAMLVTSLANGYYAKPLAGKSSSISLSKSSRRISLNVPRAQATPINPSIRKEEPKVVDNVPVAELSKPLTAYCRFTNNEISFPYTDMLG
ncbi:uncharacterized protein LOC131044534 isoform X2 [Cryptomeria japonica]|uniref:uncharacterized protein LOC131044534 isoform X2 n=1 Tax=Cryptomeria japonica TaxID=3369 RepID=UPI0025ACA89B|nr:uncharacterized protein LOC131044534 isoform X2 [Cryptomeria japonica]